MVRMTSELRSRSSHSKPLDGTSTFECKSKILSGLRAVTRQNPTFFRRLHFSARDTLRFATSWEDHPIWVHYGSEFLPQLGAVSAAFCERWESVPVSMIRALEVRRSITAIVATAGESARNA